MVEISEKYKAELVKKEQETKNDKKTPNGDMTVLQPSSGQTFTAYGDMCASCSVATETRRGWWGPHVEPGPQEGSGFWERQEEHPPRGSEPYPPAPAERCLLETHDPRPSSTGWSRNSQHPLDKIRIFEMVCEGRWPRCWH